MTALGNKEVLAKNLKYYIEKSGKDRKVLAEIWGMPYSTVTEWVNGNKYPRIDKIEIMADYFGILKSDLIEDKEKQPTDDGLCDNRKTLMEFVRSVPDDKIDLVLRVMKSIVEDGE